MENKLFQNSILVKIQLQELSCKITNPVDEDKKTHVKIDLATEFKTKEGNNSDSYLVSLNFGLDFFQEEEVDLIKTKTVANFFYQSNDPTLISNENFELDRRFFLREIYGMVHKDINDVLLKMTSFFELPPYLPSEALEQESTS